MRMSEDHDDNHSVGSDESDSRDTAVVRKWSDEETRRLIALYEEFDVLWNAQNRYYRSRVKKHEALLALSEKLDIHLNEVSRKLHNLRSQFNSELRKIKRKFTEQSVQDDYVSSWPYFKLLQFITSNGSQKKTYESSLMEYIDCKIEMEEEERITSFDDSSLHAATSPANLLEPTLSYKKFKLTSESTQCDHSPPHQENQGKLPTDEEQVFGDFCASELRQLSNPGNKRILKKLILHAMVNVAEADWLGRVYRE